MIRGPLLRAALLRRRAEAARARQEKHGAAVLRESADIAITRARRTLNARMPSLPLADRLADRERVDVADVLAVAADHFGLTGAPADAARALRARYELRSGGMDLDTDAYDEA